MNRAALLAALQEVARKPRAVKVRGLGVLHVRDISVGEMDAQIEDTKDKTNVRGFARATCRLLVDENGERLFDPDNEGDVDQVMKMMPAKAFMDISRVQDQEAEAPGN